MNVVDIEIAKQISTTLDHKVQSLLKREINHDLHSMKELSNEMCSAVARAQTWLAHHTIEIGLCSTVNRIARRLDVNNRKLRGEWERLESHIDSLEEDLGCVPQCFECNRPMSADEIGDEFPSERVCETCASK